MEANQEALRQGRAQERAFYEGVVIPAFEAFRSNLESREQGHITVRLTKEPNVVALSVAHHGRGEFRCEVKASPRQEWQPFVETVSEHNEQGQRRVVEYWASDISKEAVLAWLAERYNDHVTRHETQAG